MVPVLAAASPISRRSNRCCLDPVIEWSVAAKSVPESGWVGWLADEFPHSRFYRYPGIRSEMAAQAGYGETAAR
jgi:hypothetical protein